MISFDKIKNYLFYLIFRVRPFTRKCAQMIARSVSPGEKILEVGSGWADKKGDYYFSVEKYFDTKKVEFIKSDFNPAFGHRVVDVSKFDEKSAYDRIICFHVLDDVWEWQKAWLNLFDAVKTGGKLHIILPVFCRLDLKQDYFRFTEKAIRRFCLENNMSISYFCILGFEDFPFSYYVEISKK